jgi:hypothetical protein
MADIVMAHNEGILEYQTKLSLLPSAQPEIEERTEEFAQNVPKEDLISRKEAIDAVEHITSSMSVCVNTDECHGMKRMQRQAVIELANLPSAQPEPLVKESRTLVKDLVKDTISRQATIDALVKAIRKDPYYDSNEAINGLGVCDVRVILNDLPSAQPEIIHCKECEYGVQDEYERWYCREFGCQVGKEDGSGFCADAERRTDEANDIT